MSSTGRHTKALDVHVAEEFIYFVDNKIPFRYSHVFYWYPMVTGIQRIKPDGSGYQEIVGTGVGTGGIQGIAVDWIAGNLWSYSKPRLQLWIRLQASFSCLKPWAGIRKARANVKTNVCKS